jgi:hypothetical protein
MTCIHLKAKLAVAMLAAVSAGLASADQISQAPVELVRQTVQKEIATGNGGADAIFKDRKETLHGSETKLMVETRQGMAGMTIAYNDRALTPEQHQAEEARLSGLVNNLDALVKKQKSEKEDAERITRIIKALPDAFLYEFDGSAEGNERMGKVGDPLVRLKFRPNPRYDPPSHVEQVLTGLQGYILIDAEQHRIARIDGILIKPVGFGWGILGHLDRGGHFLVEQAEVIKGDWEVTHMSLAFTGKELLFKSINIKSDQVFSDFRPTPSNMSFAQGVELLKKQEAELAENWQKPARR